MYKYFKMFGLDLKKIRSFSPQLFAFFILKKKPSRSRQSESGVNEKCVGGQGEVCQESRKSASGGKEKCIGGQ